MNLVGLTLVFAIITLIMLMIFDSKLQAVKREFERQVRLLTDRLNKIEHERRASKSSSLPNEQSNFSIHNTDQVAQVFSPIETLSNTPPKTPTPTGVATLANEGATLTIEGSAPANEGATLANEDSAPANEDSAPANEGSAPAAPAVHEVNPQMTNSTPTHHLQPTDALYGLLQEVTNYFRTSNTIVKAGLVVILFGVSFLVKFAADQGYLPIELRLAATALGGIALTQLGWKLRAKRPDFALAVQGGGIGILFVTTFAALKLYNLIPAPLALVILVGLAGLTACLAILQNSPALAAMGIGSGFLAPVLASTGQGSHVLLFSYYALLNCGIVAISWFKAWRALNLIGFIFTFLIGSTWGAQKYQSHHFWTVEPFLILTFLMYTAIPILFAKRQKPELKGYVDGTLVFGNAVAAFSIQTRLVENIELAAAYSAAVVSLFYLLLARWLSRKNSENYRLLSEAFTALGIIFGTITIPLAFDGQWTAAVWAAEAAGIYWISIRQNKFLGRIFSSLLMFCSAFAFLTHEQVNQNVLPILNSFFLGCLTIALGALTTSFIGFRNKDKLSETEQLGIPVFFIFGTLWWILGGYSEIGNNFVKWTQQSHRASAFTLDEAHKYANNLSTIYVAAGLALCSIVGRKINWRYLTKLSFLGVLFMAYLMRRTYLEANHPFESGGVIAWPIALACHYYALRKNEGMPDISSNFYRFGHAGALWLLAFLGSWQLGWAVDQFMFDLGTGWTTAAYGVVPIGLAAVILFKADKLNWFIKKHFADYVTIGLGPVIVGTWIWTLNTNWTSSGASKPLPFIPLLNPLEAVHIFFLLTLPLWVSKLKNITKFNTQKLNILLGITYFLCLNGILMRALHHYNELPFHFSTLFTSSLVQMALSIYWSIIGISLMIYSAQKRYRWLWISGATLMGIVVSKLFIIDLSKSGTIERIVAFITVGIILLLVGYFSPIPPAKAVKKDSK